MHLNVWLTYRHVTNALFERKWEIGKKTQYIYTLRIFFLNIMEISVAGMVIIKAWLLLSGKKNISQNRNCSPHTLNITIDQKIKKWEKVV